MRNVTKLRFKQEPYGLRGNPNTLMMESGAEGWQMTYDEATGMVTFRNEGRKLERVVHAGDMAWTELEWPGAEAKTPAAKQRP